MPVCASDSLQSVIQEKIVDKTKNTLIEQTALKKDGSCYRTISSGIFTEGACVQRGCGKDVRVVRVI